MGKKSRPDSRSPDSQNRERNRPSKRENPSKHPKIFNLRNATVAAILLTLMAVGIKLYVDRKVETGKPASTLRHKPDAKQSGNAHEIEDKIFKINRRVWLSQHGARPLSAEEIDSTKRFLAGIQEKAKTLDPNDETTKILEKLLADLHGDLGSTNDLNRINLDTSFDQLNSSYADKAKEFQAEKPENTPLKDLATKLSNLGIETKHVVMSQKPNAPTIILFSQVHEHIDLESSELAEQSQTKIWEGITKLANTFGKIIIHMEGLMEDETIDNSNLDHLRSGTTTKHMKKAFASTEDRLLLVGIENEDLYELRHAQITSGDHETLMHAMEMRMTTDNIFLGQNIANHQQDQEFGVLILGGGHNNDYEHEKPLRIESVLAIRGYNVVVVESEESEANVTRLKAFDGLLKALEKLK